MFNNYDGEAITYAGLPYDDLNWYDVVGQPFGIASYFNAIILGDANNIVDTKGAMAVGGNFVSPRGLTLAFGNEGRPERGPVGIDYSPDFVRFLVGGNVAMQGPLVVNGHVVVGGNLRAAGGSTYMIGKDGSPEQISEITSLYQAPGGSQYWRLSDRGTHYAVSSYDVPRFIPASRIGADLARFFADARESITYFQECITNLEPNGQVIDHFHEWILRGNDPNQNVFVIDARPNGILNKEIRFEIPDDSLAIVKFRTGNNAHLQYGLWGDESHVHHTLYVFEDATNIYMEVPAAIWGSILAPQAMFHAHQTGGTVFGNAALGSFAVSAASGFEFHMHNFVGGVVCEEAPAELPEEIEVPLPAPTPAPAPLPEVMPAPEIVPAPAPAPCPPCPEPEPCPPQIPCPEPEPCPPQMPCPEPPPCPTCPEPEPCPPPPPCPPCPPQMPCPEAAPCPPCPECPPCPAPETRVEYQPFPVPIPMPYPETKVEVKPIKVVVPCPEPEPCEECLIEPGVIYGCIWGCSCCCDHDWEVKLYKYCDERKALLHCVRIGSCGCFEFKVPYDDYYILVVCPVKAGKRADHCKPMLTLKNVGVTNLMIDK